MDGLDVRRMSALASGPVALRRAHEPNVLPFKRSSQAERRPVPSFCGWARIPRGGAPGDVRPDFIDGPLPMERIRASRSRCRSSSPRHVRCCAPRQSAADCVRRGSSATAAAADWPPLVVPAGSLTGRQLLVPLLLPLERLHLRLACLVRGELARARAAQSPSVARSVPAEDWRL